MELAYTFVLLETDVFVATFWPVVHNIYFIMKGQYNSYLSFKEIKEYILKLIQEENFTEARHLLSASYEELGITYKEIFDRNKELSLIDKKSQIYNSARKAWNTKKERIKTRLPKSPPPTQSSQQDKLPSREDLNQLQSLLSPIATMNHTNEEQRLPHLSQSKPVEANPFVGFTFTPKKSDKIHNEPVGKPS